ncbi:hypothetical protein [Streptomyces sp. NPDC006997]|uniref:hypothetical protein n=1 Tax=Streptomyces sp. NPDC006997 TaxID=3155356 RepID=UPI0033D71775
MTREERQRILSQSEVADAQAQAERALSTVGIPPELINALRPILAAAAESVTADAADAAAPTHATAA